jgi:ribosomal protein S18 acetylase RimI-like enzyme
MIQRASVEDVEAILNVINTSNREAFQCIIPREYFRDPVLSAEKLLGIFETMTFYVYRSEGEIVGVAALSVKSPGEGQIHWVYILPRHQRKGIGKALVKYLEQEAQERGLKRLKLHTVGTAIWAISFYRKLGYHLIGKVDRDWGFDVVMERELPCLRCSAS